MKKIALIILFFSLSCAPRIIVKKPVLYQEEWQEKKIEIKPSKLQEFSKEKFRYYVKWLGLTVGEVEFENLGQKYFKDINCYHIVIKAKTNKVLNYLFRVENEWHAYINIENFKPVFFSADRREGSYRSQIETYFDYHNGKITSHSLLDNSVKEIEIIEELYDPISCFYKFRTMDLDKINYVLTVLERAKIWQIEITVLKKGDLEMRKRGVLEAFLVNVKAFSGEEKARGEAFIWFSADKRKVPLLAQVNIDIPIVGTVFAVLE